MNSNTSHRIVRAQQIDRICCQFEAAWQAGCRPSIADYLSDVSNSLRDAVLLELLPIEQHYRKQQNEAIDADEYFNAYPHLREQLESCFAAAPTKVNAGTDPSLAPALPPITLLRIPGYEIEEKLGQGGMAIVYRSRDLKLNRTVAIKMILGADEATPEDRIRMRLEAEAIARLHHPNIVELHALHEIDGQPILVMGFVAGGTLHAMLNGRRPGIAKSAEMIEALARGINHAHQKGVIHRDLKPGNILLDLEGTPKISDFGLAKRLDLKKSLTRTGIVIGTPGYMSPEQARGESDRVGTATDIHALGIILYEMLTSKSPFEGGNISATLKAVCETMPAPPSSINGSIPRDLDTICMKCLRKEPEERYASALELAQDLRRYQDGRPIFARPVGTAESFFRWSRRNPAAVTLIAILLLGMIAIGTNLLTNHFERKRKNEEIERVIDSLEKLTQDAIHYPREAYRLDDLRTEAKRLLGPVTYLTPELGERVAALDAKIVGLYEERELSRRLEMVRFQQHLLNDRRDDALVTEAAFRHCFEETLSFAEENLSATATRIRSSPFAADILGPLDNWAMLRRNIWNDSDPLRARLLRVLDLADPEPEAVRIRQAIHSLDLSKMKGDADSPVCEKLPPATLALYSSLLRRDKSPAEPPKLLLQAQRRNPSDFWINYELSVWYQEFAQTSKLHEARRYASACLALNPENAFVHQRLAFIATELNELDEAVFHLGEALRLRPDHFNIHYHAAEILSRFGYMQAATEEYRKAVRCEPRTYHHRAWMALSQLYATRGEPKAGVRAANRAIELRPNYAAAYLARGMAWLMLGQFENAFQDCQEAKRLDPEMESLSTNMVNLLIQVGELEEAISLGKPRLKSTPQDYKLRLNVAAAMGLIGDANEAAAQFEELVKAQPKYALAWYNLGEARLGLGDYVGAVKAFQEADTLGKQLSRWTQPSADSLATARRYQQLLGDLSKVIDGSRQLTDKDDLADYAQICLRRGHERKAVELYLRLFEMDREIASDTDFRMDAIVAAAKSPETHPQALIWLKEDLKRLQASDWKGNREVLLATRRELQRLKQHRSFAPIRDEKRGADFQKFWEEVDQLRDAVREKMFIHFSP